MLADEGSSIYVVASNQLAVLRPVPVDQQVNQLLALNRVQEALNLLDRTAEGYVCFVFHSQVIDVVLRVIRKVFHLLTQIFLLVLVAFNCLCPVVLILFHILVRICLVAMYQTC